MPNQGPIIIVEDDDEDQEILREVFLSLNIPNELIFFENGLKVLEYLRSTPEQPFLILTDMNLPIMGGIQLREEIYKDEQLRKKSVPYVFLSTSADMHAVKKAYSMQVQGFFQKESSFAAIQKLIKMIYDYWSVCRHPNSL
ncbi:response regulator [Paraflavisolibacter sp. H34]|uniref:response regulator n=1 Tax=Huijunlia imazamoxiresistens TaxID=3127457 RepID=UPI003016A1A7